MESAFLEEGTPGTVTWRCEIPGHTEVQRPGVGKVTAVGRGGREGRQTPDHAELQRSD